MATIYQLQGPSGHLLRVALAGPRVITGEGENRIIQEFPSPAAAREHIERAVRLHRREGYALLAVQEATDDEVLRAPDPLAERSRWEPGRRRLQVTFNRDEGIAELCDAVVARAIAAEARTLHLVCDPQSPAEALTDALAGRELPALEALILDTHFQTVTRQATNAFGDLAHVLRAMPNLTRLFATGDLVLSPARHDRLRELYLLGDPLDPALLEGLGASHLQALDTLGITLASDEGPADPAPLLRALASLRAPRLRALELQGLQDLAGVLTALAAAPLPPSWRRLVLDGSIRDEDALLRALRATAPRLGALEALGLPLGDDLSADGDEAARAILPILGDREELGTLLLPAVYDAW